MRSLCVLHLRQFLPFCAWRLVAANRASNPTMSSKPVSQTSNMEFSWSSNEQTSSQLALDLIIGRLRTNPALILALASSIRSGELALILSEEVEDFEEPQTKRMRKVIDASGTLQDLQKNQPWVLDEVLKHLLPSEYSKSWSLVLNDQDKMNVVSLVLFLDKNVCLYPARGVLVLTWKHLLRRQAGATILLAGLLIMCL